MKKEEAGERKEEGREEERIVYFSYHPTVFFSIDFISQWFSKCSSSPATQVSSDKLLGPTPSELN